MDINLLIFLLVIPYILHPGFFRLQSAEAEGSTCNNEAGSGANARGAVPGVSEALADVGNIYTVLLHQRHALDSVLHHQQHRDALLQRQQQCHQLDGRHFRGPLHPVRTASFLVAGPICKRNTLSIYRNLVFASEKLNKIAFVENNRFTRTYLRTN